VRSSAPPACAGNIPGRHKTGKSNNGFYFQGRLAETSDHHVAGWVPETEVERAAVRDQLRQIVASSSFVNSKRCANLLSFVVDRALEGDTDHLKERTLAWTYFGVGQITIPTTILWFCSSSEEALRRTHPRLPLLQAPSVSSGNASTLSSADAATLSRITGVLMTTGKSFHIRSHQSANLRDGPVVLIALLITNGRSVWRSVSLPAIPRHGSPTYRTATILRKYIRRLVLRDLGTPERQAD
jgi:hypothetical protein